MSEPTYTDHLSAWLIACANVPFHDDYCTLQMEVAPALPSPAAPVPEVGAAWMLLAGLFILWRIRRR